MKILSNSEKIACAERGDAKVRELKPRNAVLRLWHTQAASEELEIFPAGLFDAGESREGSRQRRVRLVIGGDVIDRLALELFKPEVGARIKSHHHQMRIQYVEERQKQSAVQAVFIKVVGRDIRGCDNDNAGLKKSLEQPRQNHCVGNVSDGEFIETQQPRLARQRFRHRRDWIVALHAPIFDLLADGKDASMHISAMKAWKCVRRLWLSSVSSKNMSMSAVLPRPTEPQI